MCSKSRCTVYLDEGISKQAFKDLYKYIKAGVWGMRDYDYI